MMAKKKILPEQLRLGMDTSVKTEVFPPTGGFNMIYHCTATPSSLIVSQLTVRAELLNCESWQIHRAVCLLQKLPNCRPLYFLAPSGALHLANHHHWSTQQLL